MAQPAPDNWRGAMASARAEGPGSRATSQPRNQERKPAAKGAAARSAARSTSQPKQRGKAVGGGTGKPPPALSVHEARLAKQRKECEGKTSEELEAQLQALLQRGSFGDAAYLIEASAFLAGKYKTADVVRLMLETKQFERATQLIREMSLSGNQLLVTLLVKDLVLASQFHAAVRVAQEMVEDFGKEGQQDTAGGDQGRQVGWTPMALVQAMIRARHFRTALKFAKQFKLLETFPVVPLVASMFESRAWADGVSCVMEYRLFAEFPLDVLTMRMLEQRQWLLAVKCMNKLSSKEEQAKFQQALVQEAAHVGDFVTAIMYLREFKLDQPDTYQGLLRFLVDAMVGHGEFYKAIKYAIKFELAGDEGSDTEAKYGTKALITRAIQSGQYHVATTYIKKLKLRGEFSQELEDIEKLQQARLAEFRQYMQLRMAQYDDPAYQLQLNRLIGEKALADAELIVLDPIEVDVVISETEEFFPRKKKKKAPANAEGDSSTPPVASEDAEGAASEGVRGVEESLDQLQVSESSPQRQSRFKFAQATSSTGDQSVALPSIVPDERQSIEVEPSSRPANPPGFNFAEFASSVQQQMAPQNNQPPGFHTPSTQPPGFQPPGMSPPSMLPPASSPPSNVHQSGLQSHPASHPGFQPLPPPQGFRPVAQPPPGVFPAYGNPAINGQMPPPMGGMGFSRGPPPASGPGYAPSFQPPLPPQPSQATHTLAPPYPMGSNNSTASSTPVSGSGGFDIASLAMQFHSAGSAPGFSGGFGGAPPPPPGPPSGFVNAPMRPYQHVGGYPGAPHMNPAFGFMPPPPPPPTSTFKPSVSYTTSVISTRPKK